MSWEITLLVRDRDEPLVDVAYSARGIEDPEAAAVARTVAIQAETEGALRTAGELIDHLEGMTPPQRRTVLDRARVENGLDTVADAMARRRFKQANEAARRRAADRPVPTCAVCGTRPTGTGGMPAQIPTVRKWHCPDHVAQAQPGDMDPPPLPVDLNLRLLDPDEAAAAEAEDERFREEHERRRRERKAEAEAIRVARERWERQNADDPYVNPWSGSGWSAPA